MISIDKLCPALCFYPWDLLLPIHVPMESCILRASAAGFLLVVLPLQQELDLSLCFTGGRVTNSPHWGGQNERWGPCPSPAALLVSAPPCTPREQFEVGCVGWEQRGCGLCLMSVESRFMYVKVTHVGTNTSNSVEDVGSGGVQCGGMRFWRMFLSLQYGNFMGLPQTIFYLHVSYRGSDGSERCSVCAGEHHTEAHKREKAKVFSKFFILQNHELTCINQGPPSSNIGSPSYKYPPCQSPINSIVIHSKKGSTAPMIIS